ncbi:flagellar hook-associated protein FlgK [Paracoccus suum]|uniref:Flagellar hook-associated protein 1 n=1 Tax=Paracoccus suum TaxID=2259340 RepID=A0A344PHM9_9RHOB|nr:flagellar hook-associated protein FlgK [Paracoccus suum]AXC48884.1 flagellar hook-associated protein FlgK [Paracoccus suum]
MSIASALSSAASGLAAVTRGTEVVAGNVANALTPGYTRREIVLAGLADGGGVRIAAVERIVSAALIGDHRIAGAAQGFSGTVATFRSAMETAIGVPGDGTSLVDRVSDLEAALLSAASRPDNEVRLGAVRLAAGALVSGINTAASAVEDARTSADEGISADVTRLRSALKDVARLNRSIIIDRANGRDAATLMDERQRTIDSIADIVAIREVPRDNGRIALFTAGGATLLDGDEPIDLQFSSAGRVTALMEVETPPVGRLMMNGEPVGDSLMSLFAGGSLQANFAIRDTLAPEVQAGLDAMARDLVERFADPALDPTLATDDPGLFTDAGAATSSASERGLANRLSLTAQLAADGSGDWRLRDGLGATIAGDVGRSTQLSALADRLMASRQTASTGVSPGSRSVAAFASTLSSQASTARVQSANAQARDAAHVDALNSDLLADGVDTDQEMQRLLGLEKAYAANARVIRAADEMIARILEI